MPVFNNILAGAAGQAGGAAAAGPIKSVRFNDDDSAYLNRTPSSAGNTTTWTFSCWVKRSSKTVANNPALLSAGANSGVTGFLQITFEGDEFSTYMRHSSGTNYAYTNAKLRDYSAWYHLVVAMDTTAATAADRLKMYVNGVEQTFRISSLPSQNQTFLVNNTALHQIAATKNSGGTTNNFLPGYLADLYLIDGQQLEPTDFGAFDDNGLWQAAAYSGTFGTNGFHLFDFANESGIGNDSSGNDNDWTVNNITSDATATGVSRVWSSGDSDWTITGSGQYASKSSTSSYADVFSNLLSPGTLYGFTVNIPDGDDNGGWWLGDSNSTSLSGTHPNQGRGSNSIGQRGRSASPANDSLGVHGTFATANSVTAGDSALTGFQSINPYGATEIDFVVDRANHKCWVKVASNSSWIKGGDPTDPSSTPSFHLPSTGDMYFGFNQYDDQTNLEITQFSVTQAPGAGQDVLRDVPTNGSADDDTGAGGEVSGNYCTFNPLNIFGSASMSNGNLDGTCSTSAQGLYGTIAMSSGKWFWEITNTSAGGMHGIANLAYSNNNWFNGTGGYFYYYANGNKYSNSNTAASYGDSYTTGDVVGVAYDADNGNLYFYKNGVAQNSGTAAFTGLSGTFAPFFQDGSGGTHTFSVNFGQRPFAYSAPSGYKALCTANLPTPDVPDGSAYFDTLLYTGNAGSQTISGYEFAPSFLWLKSRGNANNHWLSDAVRGAGKVLLSNATSSEQDYTAYLTGFTSDGFTLANNSDVNNSSDPVVAWAWDAGTSTVSNTDGDITSNVRANQTAGFSIVSFTGSGTLNDSVGHGLNAAPELIVTKNRDNSTYSWRVLTTAIDGSLDRLFLDATTSKADQTGVNLPTSSVFYVGSNLDHNKSGDNIIAYCFAPVAGYSAFGSYEGNGSSDGPFVHTNFRAALIIYKNADSAYAWQIYDSTRDSFNVCDNRLSPTNSNAEDTTVSFDILSNGFKIRTSHARTNNSGDTFVFAAFASNPFSSNGGLAR